MSDCQRAVGAWSIALVTPRLVRAARIAGQALEFATKKMRKLFMVWLIQRISHARQVLAATLNFNRSVRIHLYLDER